MTEHQLSAIYRFEPDYRRLEPSSLIVSDLSSMQMVDEIVSRKSKTTFGSTFASEIT